VQQFSPPMMIDRPPEALCAIGCGDRFLDIGFGRIGDLADAFLGRRIAYVDRCGAARAHQPAADSLLSAQSLECRYCAHESLRRCYRAIVVSKTGPPGSFGFQTLLSKTCPLRALGL